jgi:hypothetical protein
MVMVVSCWTSDDPNKIEVRTMQGCESGVPLYEGFAKITGIVRVCQQTYQETRLVPLSKPIFCLPQLQYNALELFFERFTAAQLDIITRVALSAREGWRIGLNYKINTAKAVKLPGARFCCCNARHGQIRAFELLLSAAIHGLATGRGPPQL